MMEERGAEEIPSRVFNMFFPFLNTSVTMELSLDP